MITTEDPTDLNPPAPPAEPQTAAETATDESTTEKFRVFVPNPETEFTVGKGDNRFVGIMGRADKGGIFFGAGLDKKMIPWKWSTYEGFKKAHTTIGIGIGGLASAALLLRSPYMGTDFAKFDLTVNGLAFAAPTTISSISAGIFKGTSAADGSIALYADQSINLATPMFFSATGGLFASVNGSITASLNAVGAASINGFVASVNGVYAATVAAINANVIGDASVHLCARDGTAFLEGKHVSIGKQSSAVDGVAYKTFLDGTQSATERVDIRADSFIHLEAGTDRDSVAGAPTRLQATKDTIRAETADAVLMLKEAATIHCGQSLMQVSEKGLKLCYGTAPIKEPVDALIKAAKSDWTYANLLADATYEKAGSNVLLGIAGGLGAAIGAVPAALATASLVEGDTATQAGAAAGAGALGGVLGAAAGLGITKAVATKLAKRARNTAKKAADAKYKAALDSALGVERQTLKIETNNRANPAIDITSDGITLAVGKTKLKITATGIEMTTPPGATVKVNGTDIMA